MSLFKVRDLFSNKSDPDKETADSCFYAESMSKLASSSKISISIWLEEEIFIKIDTFLWRNLGLKEVIFSKNGKKWKKKEK